MEDGNTEIELSPENNVYLEDHGRSWHSWPDPMKGSINSQVVPSAWEAKEESQFKDFQMGRNNDEILLMISGFSYFLWPNNWEKHFNGGKVYLGYYDKVVILAGKMSQQVYGAGWSHCICT